MTSIVKPRSYIIKTRFFPFFPFRFFTPLPMTSVIDPSTIGKPRRPRRHVRTLTGYLPDTDEAGEAKWPRGEEKIWRAGTRGVDSDVPSITKSFVNHVQTSLARQAYNLDNLGAYQAAALSVRDSLLVNWNDTQMNYTRKAPKRAYYLSLEFLMGRTLDNALLNLGLKEPYAKGIKGLGFSIEDILEQERDAGLGNGGLGRLAACYLDSAATQELPVWGYGLRYKYGIFQQLISPEGNQLEAPDPWLDNQNPWELPRLDVTYEIRFYGQADRLNDGTGRALWTGGQEVLAVAYDVMIPGYGHRTTNNLRLWESKPKRGFDLNSFNAGNYEAAVESSNSAAAITAVLYPNDHTSFGKELRLKQQYFWTAASLADIIRRFKNLGKPMTKFPEYVAIQLNDTHPTLAIPELMRILIDEEDFDWDTAWQIVTQTFFYTNHTVLPEALEKWPVPLIEHVLPRHLQIIYDINLFFLQSVERKFPGDRDRLARMSLIEEGTPKQVRMAFLACIGSRKVNGVAELHSDLVRTTILKDFVEFEGISKFGNVTNGITPRRWLDQCNPELSALISKTLKLEKDVWLKDLTKLEGLLPFAEEKKFRREWTAIKQRNKERLAHYVQTTLGYTVNTNALFDVQIKRLHEYKRQTLNILGVIHRYLSLKNMTPAQRKKAIPRVVFFAGKAAPAYYIAKLTIRLIVNVARVINNDPETKEYLTLFFLPDYSVSLAEILIPASDISQHISTAGTEASGTSNMKFCLNGGLLLGTVDGANIEIAEEVGEANVFFFGHLTPAVEDIRYQHLYHPVPIETKCPALANVIDQVSQGLFGPGDVYEPLLNTIRQTDYYLLTDDFDSYIAALAMVDEAYADKEEWAKKSIRTTAKMGKFSSDRAIMEYAESYWNLEPTPVPPGPAL
ncbi:glycogen phosphorylase [Pluteus cervinus]|uniref:Glycogen phosphorylase n=1 Tax=Pluteus cervinus TaxID=181527 RepID=A0ACD3AM69_9AGAR|nr:glycogen phosphorylase [Pluteus cervinus]